MHFWFTLWQIKTKNMSNGIICQQKCPVRLKCLTNLYRQKDIHACTYHKVTCLRAYIMKRILNLIAIWPQYDKRKPNCVQTNEIKRRKKIIYQLYKSYFRVDRNSHFFFLPFKLNKWDIWGWTLVDGACDNWFKHV